jgi:hypothetical protein
LEVDVEFFRQSGYAWAVAALFIAIAVALLVQLVRDIRRSPFTAAKRNPKNKKKCTWVRDPIQVNKTSTRWVCRTCGAFSFSSGKKVPKTCRRYEPRQSL